MEKELADALDDLILGRGVARGRHELVSRGRPVRDEFLERLRIEMPTCQPLTVLYHFCYGLLTFPRLLRRS